MNNHRNRFTPRPTHAYRPDDSHRLFLSKTAIDPSPRIQLEKGSSQLTMRVLDLICPIGMGQRGLIVAPPGSGKTTILKHICQAVTDGYPQIKLFCLLVDERPEEVTEFKRTLKCDVRSSSCDEDQEHHINVANTLMKEVYQRAADGQDVMVVIDSLTRLGRVHNARGQSSGRTMSGGVDARALEVPRRIFGSARKIEGGGSLTIMATILVETGSRMDDVIFEEFKGTGNMEIVLAREVANHRIFPAIDVHKSATRKYELLLDPKEFQQVEQLRRALAPLNKIEAAAFLHKRLSASANNAELLKAF